MLSDTENKWTPRGQGDKGEASAISWVLGQGGCAFIACGHTPSDYDLLVDFGDAKVLKVQVKTSTQCHGGRFTVAVCTRGGNQSWNRIIKYMDPSRCDYVFAHVGDGRRWFIPTVALDGGTAIRLGGPKYAQYEIEPAQPLMSRSGSTYYTR